MYFYTNDKNLDISKDLENISELWSSKNLENINQSYYKEPVIIS